MRGPEKPRSLRSWEWSHQLVRRSWPRPCGRAGGPRGDVSAAACGSPGASWSTATGWQCRYRPPHPSSSSSGFLLSCGGVDRSEGRTAPRPSSSPAPYPYGVGTDRPAALFLAKIRGLCRAGTCRTTGTAVDIRTREAIQVGSSRYLSDHGYRGQYTDPRSYRSGVEQVPVGPRVPRPAAPRRHTRQPRDARSATHARARARARTHAHGHAHTKPGPQPAMQGQRRGAGP